jgi:hypothetical protein
MEKAAKFSESIVMSAISSIVVTGDIVLDRHIYEGERATFGNDSAQGTRMVEEVGVAATCRPSPLSRCAEGSEMKYHCTAYMGG